MSTKQAVRTRPKRKAEKKQATRPRSKAEKERAGKVGDAQERSLNSRYVVRVLTEELGFSDEAIGRMASVHEGSVRRWRSKDADVGDPRPPQAKAIERIRAIALHFVAFEALKDLKGIGAWLEQINPGLEGEGGPEAPADAAMTPERYKKVMQLAQQFTKPGAGMAAYGPPGYSKTPID